MLHVVSIRSLSQFQPKIVCQREKHHYVPPVFDCVFQQDQELWASVVKQSTDHCNAISYFKSRQILSIQSLSQICLRGLNLSKKKKNKLPTAYAPSLIFPHITNIFGTSLFNFHTHCLLLLCLIDVNQDLQYWSKQLIKMRCAE